MITKLEKNDWKTELDKTTLKYHSIALWVAIIFNLLFFITDYININDYWQEFLSFRIVVSAICLFTILFHKSLKIPIQLMGVIPVFLISVQNAYMWSLMDAEHLQTHTLAYIALFIGSGMFVFYRVYYSIFIVVSNIIANVIFFHFNSALSLDVILVNGGLLTLSVAIFSILLIKMRYRLTQKELIARFALEESSNELRIKNENIVDSINYAKRIQSALIPPIDNLKKLLPDSFIFYKPKDIVSGDFYWFTGLNTTKKKGSNENLIVFSVADCTGHGVPGAFMSLIGLKAFNQSIKQKDVNSPAEALDYLHLEVFNTVNRHSNPDNIIRDGMDVALCSINPQTLKLEFAGAKCPIYVIREKELYEIKGNNQPIGAYASKNSFINHEYQLKKNDMLYIFSDGYADQFGGPKGKKFMYKSFKKLLVGISDKSMDDQYNELNNVLENWKGDLEQLDDICIIGVRI